MEQKEDLEKQIEVIFSGNPGKRKIWKTAKNTLLSLRQLCVPLLLFGLGYCSGNCAK